MLKTPVGRLRAVGFVEAISFLVLLGIAMPLKYAAGMPQAVFVVGMAHGVLWILYLLTIADVSRTKQWPSRDLLPKWWPGTWAFAALVASVLPAGPFLLEPRLRRTQEQKDVVAASASQNG